MGSIDRYIFRTTLASFALVLVSLTGVIWITQALRGIDLMTSQGQTILTFLGITSLVIPALVLIIAPIALMIAISHTLNKLATDSEIIVMNAAGFSPFRLFRPFFYRHLRGGAAGRLHRGLSRARRPAPDQAMGRRDHRRRADQHPAARPLRPARPEPDNPHSGAAARRRARRHLRRRPPRSQGARHHHRRPRHGAEERERLVSWCWRTATSNASRPASAIRRWWRSAAMPSTCRNSPIGATTSRWAFANAISGSWFRPPDDDPVFKQLPGQFRAELHDRFMAPIYPFAFAALTFAFLGAPRTTRQSRNFSIGGSILAVFGLRMAGFACSVMAVKTPVAALVQYLMLFGAIGVGLWMIIGGIVVEPPAALMEAINRSNARLARLFGRPATA